MGQYTIISKYGKRTRQLKFKNELKNDSLVGYLSSHIQRALVE